MVSDLQIKCILPVGTGHLLYFWGSIEGRLCQHGGACVKTSRRRAVVVGRLGRMVVKGGGVGLCE
jgi:hypothetical protein